MTAQIKVKVQRKAIVKLKTLPRFPSNVVGGSGIVVTQIGGSYTITLDPAAVDAITGLVVGPTPSTDNAITRFDGITGKLVKNSVVTIDNFGAAAGFTQLDVSGTNATDLLFNMHGKNSVYSMALGFPAYLGRIASGSAANPITTNSPTVSISRREALSTDAQGGQNAAIYVENIGTGTSGGAINAQPNAFTAFAQQLGTGDTVAVIGNAQQNGSIVGGTSYAAFGAFFQASALKTGTSGVGVGLGVQNGSGANQLYAGNGVLGRGHPNTIGIDVAAIGANRHTVGLYVHSNSAAGWDVGIAFDTVGGVTGAVTADIQDNTSAVTILLDQGTHTNGIDLRSGTYSGSPYLSTGFSVNATGQVTARDLIVNESATTPSGIKLVNPTATNFWNVFLDSSATFVVRNTNGNVFNVDTSGNISFTGNLFLKGNQFTAAAGAFTWTMFAATDTVVGRATTDTLTNKTLASPAVTGTMAIANANFTGVLSFTAASNIASGSGVSLSTGNQTMFGAGTAGYLWNNNAGNANIMTLDNTGVLTHFKPPVINGATSGTLTLAPTAIAGSNTATFPAATGTVLLRDDVATVTNKVIDGASNTITHAGKSGLVLDVGRSASQTPGAGAWVKVQLNIEAADPNNWFDNVTNFRFQPNVAGVFMVTGSLNTAVGAASYGGIAVYKNGAEYNKFILPSTATDAMQLSVPAIVVMNGSTDFIELFGFSSGPSPLFAAGVTITKMQIYQLY